MPKINYKREVWEGWKVQDFIDAKPPHARDFSRELGG